MSQEFEWKDEPIGWFGYMSSQQLVLGTLRRGRHYVMDFVRWGSQSATPRFQELDEVGIRKGMQKFCDMVEVDHNTQPVKINSEAARRIVLCWNACLGQSEEELEEQAQQKMKELTS